MHGPHHKGHFIGVNSGINIVEFFCSVMSMNQKILFRTLISSWYLLFHRYQLLFKCHLHYSICLFTFSKNLFLSAVDKVNSILAMSSNALILGIRFIFAMCLLQHTCCEHLRAQLSTMNIIACHVALILY